MIQKYWWKHTLDTLCSSIVISTIPKNQLKIFKNINFWVGILATFGWHNLIWFDSKWAPIFAEESRGEKFVSIFIIYAWVIFKVYSYSKDTPPLPYCWSGTEQYLAGVARWCLTYQGPRVYTMHVSHYHINKLSKEHKFSVPGGSQNTENAGIAGQ